MSLYLFAMIETYPIKKLFRIALYTSSAIGIITIGPVYIIAIILGNVSLVPEVLFKLVGISMVGITFFVLFFWTINIAVFYYAFKRKIYNQKKKLLYLFSYVILLLFLVCVRLAASPVIDNPVAAQRILTWKMKELGLSVQNIESLPVNNLFIQMFILFFVVISINTVILIIQDLALVIEKKTIIESENMQLKIKNIEANYHQLKQQLQPHFLFNSLNVLKALIKKQPDNAEIYIKRLSDFLRASVSYESVDTVRLKDELKLCNDYIEMQKIRFEDAIIFDISIPDDRNESSLPIFSIQLLLENAIKHNSFTAESPLYIKVAYEEGWIWVSNNKRPKPQGETKSGTGLQNLSERYKIISGNDIRIIANETEFRVGILVLSKNDSRSLI